MIHQIKQCQPVPGQEPMPALYDDATGTVYMPLWILSQDETVGVLAAVAAGEQVLPWLGHPYASSSFFVAMLPEGARMIGAIVDWVTYSYQKNVSGQIDPYLEERVFKAHHDQQGGK